MDIEARLHEAGYKYTKPRRMVAEVIEKHAGHMSANDIWETVRQKDDSIGRMSVYRTLDIFTQIGFIRPAPSIGPDTRNGIVYVVMHDGHHHHIICRSCGDVIEFEECGLDGLINNLQERYQVEIDSHLLEFFGTCTNCLN